MRQATIRLAGALALALISTSPAAAFGVLGVDPDGHGEDSLGRSAIVNVQARAREQALIGRLEEEIRRLTGRIEQLEYEQRNVNRRFDQLIEDLDQRLLPLEQGAGPAAGAAGEERGQAEQALNDLAASNEDEPAGEDGSLGNVPESAVAGLPRPNPADVAAPDRNTLTPEQQYEKAVQLLQAGDYQGAQGGLEVFLDLNAEHQLASNAAYWLAETHYVRQNYSAAAAAFARNYGTYGKDSSKAIDNLLKLGMSLSNLGEQDKACLTYDELSDAFPNRPAHIQQALSRERARAQCG